MTVQPVLLIHGGATNKSEFPRVAETAASLDRIALAASELFARGANALEVAGHAIRGLEADPLFNAGLGSKLQSDGIARLSASAMDGSRRRFGAVLNVQNLRHPSELALRLLEAEDRVLDGDGAHALASQLQLDRRSAVTQERFDEWRRNHPQEPFGTVGAVALDAEGRLAAFTSTGGKGNERPGRVSDSATPAGNYADAHAAISCTGIGEDILECAIAPRLAAWVEGGASITDAADRMLAELRADRRELGFIAVDGAGNFAARFSTACMAYRVWRGEVLDGWPANA
jgi:L-asparaginase